MARVLGSESAASNETEGDLRTSWLPFSEAKGLNTYRSRRSRCRASTGTLRRGISWRHRGLVCWAFRGLSGIAASALELAARVAT